MEGYYPVLLRSSSIVEIREIGMGGKEGWKGGETWATQYTNLSQDVYKLVRYEDNSA